MQRPYPHFPTPLTPLLPDSPTPLLQSNVEKFLRNGITSREGVE
ncbi:hypothetical protein [Dapis sp. BLCC M229]